MPGDVCIERPLFGGAISSCFPLRFQDVSDIREVPSHQEVFADPSRDESLIFELLDFKHEVEDGGSAVWFLRDLAGEQDAEESLVLEHSSHPETIGLQYRDVPATVSTALGQMAISKGRQGREAQNIVKVYLANLRLKEVDTDVLITAYEPILINALSESARTVGAGLAVPAAQSGCLPVAEVFEVAVTSFKSEPVQNYHALLQSDSKRMAILNFASQLLQAYDGVTVKSVAYFVVNHGGLTHPGRADFVLGVDFMNLPGLCFNARARCAIAVHSLYSPDGSLSTMDSSDYMLHLDANIMHCSTITTSKHRIVFF